MLTGSLPQQVEYRKLARDRTRLSGEMSIGRLSRFSDCLASTHGRVRIALEFVKGEGVATRVVGEAMTEVVVTCQYCMEAMTVPVAANVNLLIVASTEALLSLPQEQDGLVCETEYLTLVDVFEDELIVSLPMVPKHAEGECGDVSRHVIEAPPSDTHRPFEVLAAMKKDLNLKRS